VNEQASPKVTRLVWALIVVAIVFRAAMIPDARFTGDESFFWATARNTATLDARPVFGPSMTDSPAYHPGPLFYYLIAIPQRIGASPFWGSLLIVLLHAWAGLLLFSLLSRARGERAGLIALSLFVFAPWDVLYGDRIWLSCMAPVWGSLILYSAVRARDGAKWQAALLFFAATCPQIHMSAPIVWAGAVLLVLLNPPEKWSIRALGIGALLVIAAYGLPLHYELTHDFKNTRAILTHAGGKIDSSDAMKHPVRVLLYSVFYGSSEIGYHFGRGYWSKFDTIHSYLSLAGWRQLFAVQGLWWGGLNVISILVSVLGWVVSLIFAFRACVQALRSGSKVHLSPADRFCLAVVLALSCAAILLMLAKKGFFPHYANLLMPMVLYPIAAGIDRFLDWCDASWLRGVLWAGLACSVIGMAGSSFRYYQEVDRLNGLSVTRSLVAKVLAEDEPVDVRFEGFQNIFAWKMLAQVEHKKALPLSSSARVKYLIKNRSAHRGPVPANAQLVGGVLYVRTER